MDAEFVAHEDIVSWEQERLVNLQRLRPTAEMVAELVQKEAELLTLPRQAIALKGGLEYQIDWLKRYIRDAEKRDEIAAHRPAGCWCLGAGGRELCCFPNGVKTWREFCGCPDGLRARSLDATIRAELARKREDLDREYREAQIEAIWRGYGVPRLYRDCTLDTFPVTESSAPVIDALRRWLDSDRWLLLWGDYNVGKTGLAVGLLRVLADRGESGLFATVPDVLLRIRSTWGKNATLSEGEVLDSLTGVDVLLLDDLGAESVRDWVQERLFTLINSRHNHLKRTIITSNFGPDELAERIGERIMWRIVHLADVVELRGPNLRDR